MITPTKPVGRSNIALAVGRSTPEAERSNMRVEAERSKQGVEQRSKQGVEQRRWGRSKLRRLPGR